MWTLRATVAAVGLTLVSVIYSTVSLQSQISSLKASTEQAQAEARSARREENLGRPQLEIRWVTVAKDDQSVTSLSLVRGAFPKTEILSPPFSGFRPTTDPFPDDLPSLVARKECNCPALRELLKSEYRLGPSREAQWTYIVITQTGSGRAADVVVNVRKAAPGRVTFFGLDEFSMDGGLGLKSDVRAEFKDAQPVAIRIGVLREGDAVALPLFLAKDVYRRSNQSDYTSVSLTETYIPEAISYVDAGTGSQRTEDIRGPESTPLILGSGIEVRG